MGEWADWGKTIGAPDLLGWCELAHLEAGYLADCRAKDLEVLRSVKFVEMRHEPRGKRCGGFVVPMLRFAQNSQDVPLATLVERAYTTARLRGTICQACEGEGCDLCIEF